MGGNSIADFLVPGEFALPSSAMPQTPPQPQRFLRPYIEWSVLILLGLLLGAALAWLLYRDQAQVVEREQDHLSDQARVVNDNLGLQLEALNRALTSLREDFGATAVRDLSAAHDVMPRLRDYAAILPGVRTLSLVDAQGKIWASSRPEIIGHDVRERSFFSLAQAGRDPRVLYVSPPFMTNLGVYSINVARVITDEKNRFAGIVAATLSRVYGETVLRSVLYAPDMEVTLHHASGELFARAALDAERPGKGEPLGVQRLLLPDGMMFDNALLITASRERNAVLQPWRAQAGWSGTIYALVLAGMALGLLYYQRRRELRERLKAERRLAENQLKLSRVAIESSADAAFWIKRDGRVVDCNQAACDRLGYSREEMLSLNVADIDPGYSDEVWAIHFEELRRVGTLRFESRERTKDGRMITVEIVANYVRFGDEEYNCAFARDITERKKSEAEIERLAFYDVLTGLPNRRLLLDRLAMALAQSRRTERCGALLFLDMDNFKDLNDTLGHDFGDELLRQVAQRLQTCVRDSDTVARFGGDEFVILFENLDASTAAAAEQAEAIARKLLAALNQPYMLGTQQRHSTPSIGIAMFDGRGEDDVGSLIDELLKRADLAMYQAKSAGRNTLSFFDPGMQAAVSARSALEMDLRQALQRQELLLYFQPVVDQDLRLSGAEALVRWQHPQRGLISPAEFIPLAERSNLILHLGLWVLQSACEQLARWGRHEATASLSLSVNVSAQQFRHPDFVPQVVDVLKRTGASSERLTLELTESLLLNDVEDVTAKMSQLKTHGVGFSLDDFGTGYSSLSYLKRLPIDLLKIDQSFVRDILNDPNDAAIAKTVLALARSLDLGVVAEGVEETGQMNFLVAHGCQAFQGYLFGKPVPLEEFEHKHFVGLR